MLFDLISSHSIVFCRARVHVKGSVLIFSEFLISSVNACSHCHCPNLCFLGLPQGLINFLFHLLYIFTLLRFLTILNYNI